MLRTGIHNYKCQCGKKVEWNIFPLSLMTDKQNRIAEKHILTQLCKDCYKKEITDKIFQLPRKPVFCEAVLYE